MDPFIGEIRLFSFAKIPTGWLPCNGQTLNPKTYPALFTLLGVAYGGNGTTTFMLPDLRGRVPIHRGTSPSNTQYAIGNTGGLETVTLTASQMPTHAHTIAACSANANTLNPTNAYPAALVNSGSNQLPVPPMFAPASKSPTVELSPLSLASTGGSQPHTNLQPYLAMNYCIAIAGIYPPRP